MTMRECERVMHEWCAETGMDPWDATETKHVEIDDTVIGLIYGEERTPDVLYVFCDLGEIGHVDLQRRLLEMNTDIEYQGNGYFGLHSESGTVVYRVNIPLTPQTNGAQLPIQISEFIETGRQRMLA